MFFIVLVILLIPVHKPRTKILLCYLQDCLNLHCIKENSFAGLNLENEVEMIRGIVMAICLRPGLSPTTPVVPTILQHCTKQPIQHSDYSMLDSLQHWSTLFQKSVQNSQCLSHEGELQLHELQEFHGDQRSQRSQWFQSQRFQRSDLRHELFVEGWNLTGISWTGRAMKFYILGWNMIPIKKRTGSKPPFCCFIGAALSITLQRCQETIHLMTSFLSSRIASSHCLTD